MKQKKGTSSNEINNNLTTRAKRKLVKTWRGPFRRSIQYISALPTHCIPVLSAARDETAAAITRCRKLMGRDKWINLSLFRSANLRVHFRCLTLLLMSVVAQMVILNRGTIPDLGLFYQMYCSLIVGQLREQPCHTQTCRASWEFSNWPFGWWNYRERTVSLAME